MQDDTKKQLDLTLRLSDAELERFKQFVLYEHTHGIESVNNLPDAFWDLASCIAKNQLRGGDDYYLAYTRGYEKAVETYRRAIMGGER